MAALARTGLALMALVVMVASQDLDCKAVKAQWKQCQASKVPKEKKDWLESPCTTDADCKTANAVCFESNKKCLCTPGYYYSVKDKTCNAECTALSDTFVTYPGNGLTGNNLPTGNALRGVQTEDCKAKCLASAGCLALDTGTLPPGYWGAGTWTCSLNMRTPLNAANPSDWTEGKWHTYDYLQRACQ